MCHWNSEEGDLEGHYDDSTFDAEERQYHSYCTCSIFVRADMSGWRGLVSIEDINCIGLNAAGATLSGSRFTGSDLTSANFGGATLRDVDFSGAHLAGANFSGADLEGADLRDTTLSGANFTGANLTGADLRDTTLSGANFSGTGVVQCETTETIAWKGADGEVWLSHHHDRLPTFIESMKGNTFYCKDAGVAAFILAAQGLA